MKHRPYFCCWFFKRLRTPQYLQLRRKSRKKSLIYLVFLSPTSGTCKRSHEMFFELVNYTNQSIITCYHLVVHWTGFRETNHVVAALKYNIKPSESLPSMVKPPLIRPATFLYNGNASRLNESDKKTSSSVGHKREENLNVCKFFDWLYLSNLNRQIIKCYGIMLYCLIYRSVV